MANPCILGGFPAAALIYRQKYIRCGKPVFHEERRLDDIWQTKSTLLAEEEAFDPNRDAGAIPQESPVKTAVNPLAYLVDPVEVKYGGDPARNTVDDLSRFIDERKKLVTSVTGELVWDYGTSVCRLTAARAQGVCGFLAGAGPFDLGAVRIEANNPYAAILVVSLHGIDLKESGTVLVPVNTKCRPYGWKESAAPFQGNEKKHTFQGYRIDDTGSAPWNVSDTDATVALQNAGLSKATLLDANGYPVKAIPAEALGGALRVKLPRDAMYVVLE